jgi:8-amino-7-oxononanoate synthase
MPYGSGGGGSLRANDLSCVSIVVVSSLAKGFGVPMAMIAGSAGHIARFETGSMTMINSSPPSFADLHAAQHALELNRKCGDALRRRLCALIRRFRRGLLAAGICPGNSLFPVQSLMLNRKEAHSVHQSLARLGIQTVLHRPGCKHEATISFIITARHTSAAIDRTVEAIACALTDMIA